MTIALLLTAVLWSAPAPTLWECVPGKSPHAMPYAACTRVQYRAVRFRISPLKVAEQIVQALG
jgi:hypothetical protein